MITNSRVIDFAKFHRAEKVRVFTRAIDAYTALAATRYTPADIVRAAPSWTYAMWTSLTAFASQTEGRTIGFPSPETQADVIEEYRKRDAAITIARALFRRSS